MMMTVVAGVFKSSTHPLAWRSEVINPRERADIHALLPKKRNA